MYFLVAILNVFRLNSPAFLPSHSLQRRPGQVHLFNLSVSFRGEWAELCSTIYLCLLKETPLSASACKVDDFSVIFGAMSAAEGAHSPDRLNQFERLSGRPPIRAAGQ